MRSSSFLYVFPAPAERGTRTASAGSPLTGGEFFAEPQRGDSPSADGGNVAAPAAGTTPYPRRWAKRKDNLRFSFLFELLPFPYFLSWRKSESGDRFENRGTAVGLPQRVFLRLFAVHRQRTATHAGYSTQSAAYPCRANPWHVVTHGTCEDKLHRTPNP